MSFIITSILLIILIVVITNKNNQKESFDGIGKGFGMYYHPRNCCKSKDCYPGMYIGKDFWLKNWFY